MSGRRVAAAVAALATWAAVAPLPAAAAGTDATDQGLWYLTTTGVAEAHERTTGEGITIAVIDGPVNPAAPDLVGTDLVVGPGHCGSAPGAPSNQTSTDLDAEHATAITSLILGTGAGAGGEPGTRGVAPGATVLHYSMHPRGWSEDVEAADRPSCVAPDGTPDAMDVIARSIDDAVAQGADIISMSSGGVWEEVVGLAVARAYAAGTVIVAAAGNDGLFRYPGHGNGVVMVEQADVHQQLDPPVETTESPYLAVVAPGTDLRIPTTVDGSWDHHRLADGTSYAAPWTAGVLALAWSEHPDATGNQMIQALIRNTAVDNPDLTHDDQWGYGPVSVTKLLAADPTQYPDENPLLHPLDDLETVPTTQQVLDAAEAEPGDGPTAEATGEPSATAAPVARDDAGDGSGSALPVVLGPVGVLAAAAVAVALLVRRRSTDPTAPAARREP